MDKVRAEKGTERQEGLHRIFVPTLRTQLMTGGDLNLKGIILAQVRPKDTALYCCQMGKGECRRVPLNHTARRVYSVAIPTTRIKNSDLEYYVRVSWTGGGEVHLPATAPQMNQTVVVTVP